jgi:hypothetical protein
LGGNRYLLMWEQIETHLAYYAVIDGSGNLLSSIKEIPIARLSHNDVLRYNKTNGRVYWAISSPDDAKKIAIYSFEAFRVE